MKSIPPVIAFVLLFALAAPAAAVTVCPGITPTITTPICAEFSPPACPTQAECDQGWTWAAPHAPIPQLPFGSRPDGTYSLCYFDPPSSAFPDCNDIYPSLPPPPPPPLRQTVPLRQFCQVLRGLNPPVRAVALQICGTEVGAAPTHVLETAAAVLAWQHVGPGKLARIRRMGLWVLEGR